MENIILFGYPRSGNHWLRYILEYLTQKDSYGNLHVVSLPSSKAAQPLRLDYPEMLGDADTESGEILFSHGSVKQYLEPYSYNTKLIFSLRSYKECVIRQQSRSRHYDTMDEEFLWKCIKLNLDEKTMFGSDDKYRLPTYLDHLYIFSEWKGEKLLIYYEDLIQDTATILDRLIKFLKIDPKKKETFLMDLDVHKANSLEFYKNHIAEPESGENIHFHSEKKYNKSGERFFGGDFWVQIDKKLDDIEYLKRYGA